MALNCRYDLDRNSGLLREYGTRLRRDDEFSLMGRFPSFYNSNLITASSLHGSEEDTIRNWLWRLSKIFWLYIEETFRLSIYTLHLYCRYLMCLVQHVYQGRWKNANWPYYILHINTNSRLKNQRWRYLNLNKTKVTNSQ